jgi:DNA-binding response OmpR family regulator
MRVLLIEDEIAISQPLCKMLEKNNIPADAVYDGVSGFMQANKNIYDVIILDIMLPEMNGLTLLKKLRNNSILTPVLLLTAKDSVDDKVRGLEIGADDYLTKPFSTYELIARVKALARRRPDILETDVISFADITLDTNSAQLTIGGDTTILPVREARLLEMLIKNSDKVVSKDFLLDTVWGLETEAAENTVEIYIHYLRKKIKGSRRAEIVTQRGLGYKLMEKADAE